VEASMFVLSSAAMTLKMLLMSGEESSAAVLPVAARERYPKNMITFIYVGLQDARFQRPTILSFGVCWMLGWERRGQWRKVVVRGILMCCVSVKGEERS
jgi:hypothetical protein